MASTRNRNTPGNYNLEQTEYKQSANYTLYANSQYGAAYNTQLPGNGLMPAQISQKLYTVINKLKAEFPSLLFLCNRNVALKKTTIIPLYIGYHRTLLFHAPNKKRIAL